MRAVATFDALQIQRTSTAQQVASGLSDMIMGGSFAAGDRLRESAIATSLGVARNTVREAVRILEQGGLVRYEMHRGAVVIEPSVDEVNDLYEARLKLEVSAVRDAPPSRQVEGVRAAFEELCAAADSGQAQDIVAKDLAFHAAVVGLLGSRRIDAFYAQLTTELRFYLMVLTVSEREYERPGSVVDEHRPILEALEAGDLDAAAAALTQHIKDNARRVRAIFDKREAASVRRPAMRRGADGRGVSGSVGPAVAATGLEIASPDNLVDVSTTPHLMSVGIPTEENFSNTGEEVKLPSSASVGAAVRAERKRRGLTLRELSEATGLSESFLSQFERGLTQASISSLRSITTAIGIALGDLFEVSGSPGVRVLRKSTRPTLPYGNDAVKHLMTPKPQQHIEVFTVKLGVGGSTGDEQFTHGDSEEFLLVMVGSVKLELSTDVFLLEEGDSIVFRSSVLHRVVNVSPEPSEALWVISPPG